MEDYGDMGDTAPTHLAQPPAQRRLWRKWLLIAGLALAFTLTLGVGALLGSTVGSVQAASSASGGNSSTQAVNFASRDANSALAAAATPGAHGQCDALTVSSVNGRTILAKAADGSTVTIHTTASTQYTRDGQSVSASAITAGTRIHVTGTRNSDGSITATRIDIG